MKRRIMRRDDENVSAILERRYWEKPFAEGDWRGVAGLIEMLRVSKPVVVGNLKIIDAGMAWLQFAFFDKNYWLTVLLDEKGEVVQYYFDITAGNFFDEEGGPWFYDLYLDVTMEADGIVKLLDEDELAQALTQGLIDEDLYALAKNTAEVLIEEITGKKDELRDFVTKILNTLFNK